MDGKPVIWFGHVFKPCCIVPLKAENFFFLLFGSILITFVTGLTNIVGNCVVLGYFLLSS